MFEATSFVAEVVKHWPKFDGGGCAHEVVREQLRSISYERATKVLKEKYTELELGYRGAPRLDEVIKLVKRGVYKGRIKKTESTLVDDSFYNNIGLVRVWSSPRTYTYEKEENLKNWIKMGRVSILKPGHYKRDTYEHFGNYQQIP